MFPRKYLNISTRVKTLIPSNIEINVRGYAIYRLLKTGGIHMSLPQGIWPEDPTPFELRNCQKCSLSQQRSRVLWGEGNPNAKIFVLLDNPGAREDKFGVPFICGTRPTLYFAVTSVGLGMNDLYLTYVVRCRPVRKYDKEQARSTCIRHLNICATKP